MKPARIIIAYAARPPIVRYLTAALERQGIAVEHVYTDENTYFDRFIIHRANKLAHSLRLLPKNRNLFANHPLAHFNYRNRQLRNKVAAFKPDLVLFVRGQHYDVEMAGTAKRFGWWVEGEEYVEQALAEAHQFDWYYFISESCVATARERGFSSTSYMHHRVDTDEFHKHADLPKRYDWCFVGSWSKKRMEYIEAAMEVSKNGAVYGPKWLRKNPRNWSFWPLIKGKRIEDEKLNRLYNQSRVVINITNWGRGDGAARSGFNLRVLEVPATGSFLLTDGSNDLNRILIPGTHAVTYEGVGDFKSKLAHFLAMEDERERIAAAGLEWVRSMHSYDQVAEQIIADFDALTGTEQSGLAT